MTLRTLILTPYYFPIIGGVESNAGRFARYLRGRGLGVRVLTKRLTRSLPDRDTLDEVPVRRIGPKGDRSAAGKWLMIPAVFFWLVRHAREYDAVCSVDYRGVGIAAIAARALTGRPVLVQAQTTGVLSGSNADAMLRRLGASADGTLARLVKWPARAVYARADAFACIAHEIEREALACAVPPERVHYLPNAIDMTSFSPASPDERARLRLTLDLPTDAVVCLFVGRLSREKGVLDLVEAWNHVRPTTALLLIAGPDMPGHAWDAGPTARAFVQEHGLQASVRFLGPTTDVAGLLRVSDIAVQPSHFEALGLSAIEALAVGVPVVASAVGGLLDFVVDGVNGRLVSAQDSEALATALSGLIADSAERQRFAAAARASVAQYDEREVFGRMVDVLATLASRSGS